MYGQPLTVCDAETVKAHVISPLSDARWDDLVAGHPRASVFHQRGWLEALARTYGYKPLVFTTASAGEPLSDGIVLCRVSSWITGTRLVSLPFADHCEPLLSSTSDSAELMNHLRQECDRQRWRYVELRPSSDTLEAGNSLRQSASFWIHELDTRPNLDKLYEGLHKNSFQRKIHRAKKEHISYEAGNSRTLLNEFYFLVLLTRRRHRLLPQPRIWFKNLLECLGDKIEIGVARKDGVAIAAMLTLRHRSSIMYKYGCSDKRFHNLGAMPFLFWKLIERAKAARVEKIDLGRTDMDNEGLIRFKDRLGTTRKLVRYYRYSGVKQQEAMIGWSSRALRGLYSILPDTLLETAGGVLYRHIG